MNPYASRLEDIPAADSYDDLPCYGRYHPRPDEFRVNLEHVDSESPVSLQYWTSVIDLCDESVMIYPADEGGRDVFALGNVIVKSSHLHETREVDYSYADSNEVNAISLARDALKTHQIGDRQVLIQERVPGVGLNVALPYLSPSQKASFKKQARAVLRRLSAIKPADGSQAHRHVVHDPNITTNGRINPLEAEILFSHEGDSDAGFMHNDFTDSNCIVDDDRIVGLVDWEMAGFFGWKTAGEIHRRIRTPQREHFTAANLSEETLRDIMWWSDLYDDGRPESDD
ncbi:hypothetical protein CPLU01_07515 [Colletotrichum plurivorum]|uniref:Aminoglycoside phosphotransferase domain-containing protein n=1 Tax=Colletotrichum plurivorum TaxID=2175906 RepID=A0A8H6KFH4_9PEZI|nr:hypothetical protein CPLU01_07515 [Colletotrichum plurivorum]